MKDFVKYAIHFTLVLLVLMGAAAVIRQFGGGTDLMIWLLAVLYCSSVASDIADDKSKSEKS